MTLETPLTDGANEQAPNGDDENFPCGEGMCRCYCDTWHGPCGCDCPRDEDGQLIEG